MIYDSTICYNKYMLNFFKQFLDFIYKKRCYFCKSSHSGKIMCDNCFNKIPIFPYKPIKQIKNIDIFCVTLYKDETQKLIRAVKYHNKKDMAYYQAKLMYDYWIKLNYSDNEFVIIPVPMHESRKKERSYNHMELVAQEFIKLAGEKYKLETNLIKRIKNTKPQYKLSKKEREENLKDAFALCENYQIFQNKKILIFDDIFTTGSTMQEMIKTFQNKGLKDLHVLITSCSKYNVS